MFDNTILYLIISIIFIVIIIIIVLLKTTKKSPFMNTSTTVMSDGILRGVNPITIMDDNSYNILGTEDCLQSLRIAGSIHKKVRRDMRPYLKPGLDLIDLSTLINNRIRYYTNNTGYNGGIGFPPIPSMSNSDINMIAHYSPYKDKKILTYNDNLKIDFGVHVNGWIVDSSSTIYFNPEYDILNIATKDALNSALKIVGIDSNINDVSSIIEEVITSYEIFYKNKTHTLKVIDDCGGHCIKQYNIHGGIHIANKPVGNKQRFTKGIYAIEPFATIMNSKIYDGNERNNYRIKPSHHNDRNPLYKLFNYLIFSDSHLEYYNINNIDDYIKKGMIDIYPSVYGMKGDMSCQYEHTVYLDENIKEVISQSDDY